MSDLRADDFQLIKTRVQMSQFGEVSQEVWQYFYFVSINEELLELNH